MNKGQSLKRRVLREAVRENVDVINGRYRGRNPRSATGAHAAARVFFLVAVPLALLVSTFLIARTAGNWIERREGVLEQIADRDAASAPDAKPAGFAGLGGGLGRPLSAAQVAAIDASAAIDPEAFPLDVRRVILDPGHGGRNIGTEAPSGLVEKEIALDISHRLKALLDDRSFDVVLTREDDEFISLEDRAVFANSERGDMFVSIHLNWIETREVRGVETYYLGPTNDPYLTQLAAAENKDSGYSMADFRSMIDRVYAGVRQSESERLAAAVQQSLYNSLRRVNPQLQDRGVKKAPFIVLMGTTMPAILAEVSCLSNEQEARLLMTPEYRQYIAEALFEGIDSYARQVRGSEYTGS